MDRYYLLNTVLQGNPAAREVLRPDKINLASLGNVVPHLHWHVIPRFADDRHFPAPVWATPQREVATAHTGPIWRIACANGWPRCISIPEWFYHLHVPRPLPVSAGKGLPVSPCRVLPACLFPVGEWQPDWHRARGPRRSGVHRQLAPRSPKDGNRHALPGHLSGGATGRL